jgi:hypothetical protein
VVPPSVEEAPAPAEAPVVAVEGAEAPAAAAEETKEEAPKSSDR